MVSVQRPYLTDKTRIDSLFNKYEPKVRHFSQNSRIHERLLAPSQWILLPSVPKIYDATLVEMMKLCVVRLQQSMQEFGSCVTAESRKMNADRPLLKTWAQVPAMLNPVSGVRDKPYVLGEHFGFLRRPVNEGSNEMLWPLNFFIQASFDNYTGDTDVAWKFEYLADRITQSVSELVRTNPSAREIFTEVASFTVLQRVFRSALNGEFGGDFPVEQLVILAKSLSKSPVPVYQTRRWEVTPTTENTLYTGNNLNELRKALAVPSFPQTSKVTKLPESCRQPVS